MLIVKLILKQIRLPFLAGVLEEKARLLQWLVFFVSSPRAVHFFVHLFNFLHERLTQILVRIKFQSSDVTFSSSDEAFSKFESSDITFSKFGC